MTCLEALLVLAEPPGQERDERRRAACETLYRAGLRWLGCDPRQRPSAKREESADVLADLLASWLADGFTLGRPLDSDEAAKAYVLRAHRNRRLDRLEQEGRFVTLKPAQHKDSSTPVQTMEVLEKQQEARKTREQLQRQDLPDLRAVVETGWAAVPDFERTLWDPEALEQVALALVRQLRVSAEYFQQAVLETGRDALEPAVSWERMVKGFMAFCFVTGMRMKRIESSSSQSIFADTFDLLVRIRCKETTVTRLLDGSPGSGNARADEFARERNRLYRRIHDLLKGLELTRQEILTGAGSLLEATGIGRQALVDAKAWIDDLRVKARRTSESGGQQVSTAEEET